MKQLMNPYIVSVLEPLHDNPRISFDKVIEGKRMAVIYFENMEQVAEYIERESLFDPTLCFKTMRATEETISKYLGE